jgi:imidazolonepropionase-like amidohydrolase
VVLPFALLAAHGLAFQTAPASAASPPALEFRNGRWFDGERFVERTLYAAGGIFTDERPTVVERTLDLAGGFVVPPFAEAHNHNLHDGADAALRKYLEQGVFYVKNPNSLARTTSSIRAQVNRPDSIDAVFSGGGLTASGGHPCDVARPMIERGVWGEADADGGFYFTLDSEHELVERWPAIRAQPRDFLKTYLLYSEEYALRRDDEALVGWRGLDPAMLPEIVRRAHAEGWRVSTHVETAADFRHALAARVDEINHLPGFRPRTAFVAELAGMPLEPVYELSTYALTAEDARQAAEQGTVVVTTIGGLLERLEAVPAGTPEGDEAAQVIALLRANLALLREQRVSLALGSDEYDLDEGTVVDEFLAVQRLGVIPPAELLRRWCEDTARTIFPARKLGRLEPGYEASLLVLGGDPLADPARVRDIRLRVKQGRVLELGR